MGQAKMDFSVSPPSYRNGNGIITRGGGAENGQK